MSRATESALADPQQVIANLQHQLDERTADALRRELADARKQQTATAGVLQVINSSPSDLPPVFAAMREKAINLCAASFDLLMRYDGDALSRLGLRERRRPEPLHWPRVRVTQPVPRQSGRKPYRTWHEAVSGSRPGLRRRRGLWSGRRFG